jgi:hypothetical protein
MAFEIRKIGDVGVGHPIVARLGVQTSELISFADLLEENRRKTVVHLYAVTLKDRLLRCQRLRDELVARANAAMEELPKQRDPRVRNVPHVIDLQATAENFLYEAKNFLRDLLELFRVAYDCDLKDASDFTNFDDSGNSKVADWSAGAFGDDDDLTKLLKTEQKWIAQVIQSRRLLNTQADAPAP